MFSTSVSTFYTECGAVVCAHLTTPAIPCSTRSSHES